MQNVALNNTIVPPVLHQDDGLNEIFSGPLKAPKPHHFPESAPRSRTYQVKAQGLELDVLRHSAADHTSFEFDGQVKVEIELPEVPKNVLVRPLSRGIKAQIIGCRVCFTLAAPQNLQIEIEGHPLLYIYALPYANDPPTGPHVRRFEGGKIHEAGQVTLSDGEVCWIEAGAILRGSIRADHAKGVGIGGYGILDGGYWMEHGIKRRRKAIVLDHCTDARVDDILMLSPCHWMLVLGACERVTVDGVRQIADDVSSDGIDIAGSKQVRISGCCLHNGDDNIAIKAIHNKSGEDERVALGYPNEDWKGTVEDVVVSGCTFYNTLGGSSMEIGYETSTEHIRNILFENCDVLGVHEFGSVFGIHNGDRACVENVLWDEIRVEHHFDSLVDIRVLKSRWNVDSARGHIRNITLRNIRVIKSIHNEGYTVSIISGYDADHPVIGICLENFYLGGRKITNADELDLVTRHAHDITFW